MLIERLRAGYGLLPEVIEMGFMTDMKIAIVNLWRKAGALQYQWMIFLLK